MRFFAVSLLSLLAGSAFGGEIAADRAAQMLTRVPTGVVGDATGPAASEASRASQAPPATSASLAPAPQMQGLGAEAASDDAAAHEQGASEPDARQPDERRDEPEDGHAAMSVGGNADQRPVAADESLQQDESLAAEAGVIGTVAPPAADDGADSAGEDALDAFCNRIDTKLSSIDYDECIRTGLIDSGAVSNDDTPIYYRDFVPAAGEPVARVLLIGGIHGDEYSSVSVVFRWLNILRDDLGENFHWRIVPVLNPDGLLRPPRMSQRMNANGVDLNRNFPTPNWEVEAHAYWVNRTSKNERRYPGPAALSEPESSWLAEQIETFGPHAVISVHAPHGVVDFDGPRLPPRRLGPLELRLLGTYPGSMGRYIGVHKGIPILTVELESAFGMPQRNELLEIWYDMLGWLHEKIATPMQLAKEESVAPPPTELLRVETDPDNDG